MATCIDCIQVAIFCPPRPSLSLVRGPPVFRPTASGGGQTWRWVGGWCFALCVGFAECEGTPPAPAALPPKTGASSWLFRRWCFAPGRFECCNEFQKGAKCEPRRPNPRQEAHQTWGTAPKARRACPRILQNLQQEAHQTWGAAPSEARRGGLVPALCKTFKKSKTPTDQPTPGLPPPERSEAQRGPQPSE